MSKQRIIKHNEEHDSPIEWIIESIDSDFENNYLFNKYFPTTYSENKGNWRKFDEFIWGIKESYVKQFFEEEIKFFKRMIETGKVLKIDEKGLDNSIYILVNDYKTNKPSLVLRLNLIKEHIDKYNSKTINLAYKGNWITDPNDWLFKKLEEKSVKNLEKPDVIRILDWYEM